MLANDTQSKLKQTLAASLAPSPDPAVSPAETQRSAQPGRSGRKSRQYTECEQVDSLRLSSGSD